jgi:hypothetical protein
MITYCWNRKVCAGVPKTRSITAALVNTAADAGEVTDTTKFA